MSLLTDTIAAIATGGSAGGIGIVRISGERALEVARKIAPGLGAQPEPRRMLLTPLLGSGAAQLDEGLAVFFREPASFTGEDVVELHGHGGRWLVGELLQSALSAGARLAEPGEFTRRAFVNGRLDLARAEAVADLIEAQSQGAAMSALRQLRGGLSQKVSGLRSELLDLQADLEAYLDFPDEAPHAGEGMASRLEKLTGTVKALQGSYAGGRRMREGVRVVLFGASNAGKSSIFNWLCGSQRALVDADPGTTRDVLEAALEWEGLSVTLVDTAGLREGGGRIESMGMERSRRELEKADLGILVADLGALPHPLPLEPRAMASAAGLEGAIEGEAPLLIALNKSDLRSAPSSGWPVQGRWVGALAVSVRSGEGLRELRNTVRDFFRQVESDAEAVVTSARHADALNEAMEALDRAARPPSLDAMGYELRLAVEALGSITGETASDELLDRIFARFCIGK